MVKCLLLILASSMQIPYGGDSIHWQPERPHITPAYLLEYESNEMYYNSDPIA